MGGSGLQQVDIRLAANIKRERINAGLSIADCCRAISLCVGREIFRSAWYRWEEGRDALRASWMPYISRILGVSIARLYDERPIVVRKLRGGAVDTRPIADTQ